jgi:hypothetical protein
MNIYFVYVINSILAALVYAHARDRLKFGARHGAPCGRRAALGWASAVWLCWPLGLPAYLRTKTTAFQKAAAF